MLSVFPSILFLAPLSAFIIRVALAVVFFHIAKKHWKHHDSGFHILAAAEFATALSLGAGAWTQAGAAAGCAIALLWMFRPSVRPMSFIAIFFSIILCLSLILTGAGPFAFDLPL